MAKRLNTANYEIASTTTTCWRCKKATSVFCVVLHGNTVHYNLQEVSPSVLEELETISAGKYRMDHYNQSSIETLMNHCEHCGVRQSEKALNTPASSASTDHYAFAFITLGNPPAPISVKKINKPFAALGTDWVMYSGTVIEGKD